MLNRSKLSFLFVLVTAVLFGCGGGGGGGNSLPSPFAGTFAGTWTANNAENGTATLTIANSGNLTGTTHNITLDIDGSLSGSVSDNGDVTGTYTYPGIGSTNVTGTVVLSNGGNTMTGAITGSGITTSFSLTRQP